MQCEIGLVALSPQAGEIKSAIGWIKAHPVGLLAVLGGLVVGAAVGAVGSKTSTKTTTIVRTTVVTTTAVEVTNSLGGSSATIDCPGRVRTTGAGIGNISVEGTSCNTATAVLSAQDHLGWKCRYPPGGPNGFPGECTNGDRVVRFVAGD